MIWVLAAALLVVAAGFALAGISRILARRYALPTPSDEIHRAPTRDGWLIGLRRYLPEGEPAGREPVLLCHGLLSTRFSLDLVEGRSLARYLRRQGFDVWLMDLRAHGDSVRENGSRGRADWSLDAYVHEDLPAAVRYVLKATGARKLHWVGHSLGGMILYAHCLDGDRSWFRSAVTLDSPGHLGPLRQATWPGRLYARIFPIVPVLIFKPIFHLLSSVVPERVLLDDLMLDRATLRLVLYNALIDTGSSMALMHLSRMVADGRFESFDGKLDYEEGPARIEFPLLVLRSPRSRAPEPCVRHAFDSAPAAEKEYRRLGRAEGFAEDHNHFSIVLGKTAEDEVFPIIGGWLRERSAEPGGRADRP